MAHTNQEEQALTPARHKQQVVEELHEVARDEGNPMYVRLEAYRLILSAVGNLAIPSVRPIGP